MWVKYKKQIINLSMQTRIKKGDKFPNELIFSDIAFRDGKHRRFDYHCYNISSEEIRLEFLESNLLDLDKELNDNE